MLIKVKYKQAICKTYLIAGLAGWGGCGGGRRLIPPQGTKNYIAIDVF